MNDLAQSVDQKICERRRLTILEMLCEFPQISRPVLYKIITLRLGYHKFRATWFPKMPTDVHKTQRMAAALTSFLSDVTNMAMKFSITSYE
jgi:hypothetical protein